MKNTDYMNFIRSEIKELDTKDPDLLTELIMDSLVEMNGSIPDATQGEIYDYVIKAIAKAKGES